ncbi:extensin-like domain-containing protein [Mesorhizobium xinjiangense]|uniref:extensin-like domain-containing protein n=1 Tax=Mesorhizobium xinjiangense TaxID=2678685 RepID=UPI0018DBC102|nr:extensin family protein [Mesorhizobium xinjiangense]
MSRPNRIVSNARQAIAATIFLAVTMAGVAGAAPNLPETVPLPGQRPAGAAGDAARANKSACQKKLKALGVGFSPQPPVVEGGGCAIERPVLVERLAPGIALEPPALVNCATAETAARFARDIVAPAAKEHLGAGLVSVRQSSGYVCRPRNGTKKLSEHAFGNALDISGFVLADERTIPVAASGNRAVRDFLREVRGAACGPFKTVLGPGSNADHAHHFHFDLAKRRNGATYCR